MRGEQDQSLGASRKHGGDQDQSTGLSSAEMGTRRHILVTLDPKDVRLPWYPFYALILPGLAARELRTYLRENWLTLDTITGGYALLLTPVIPSHVTDEYLAWWRDRLPAEIFNELQTKLEHGLDPGAEDRAGSEVYRMAAAHNIDVTKLPLMMITSAAGDKAHGDLLLQMDPNWSEVELGRFFQDFAAACRRCAPEANDDQRLDHLKRELEHILRKYRSRIPTVRTIPSLRYQVVRGLWSVFAAALPTILKAILAL